MRTPTITILLIALAMSACSSRVESTEESQSPRSSATANTQPDHEKAEGRAPRTHVRVMLKGEQIGYSEYRVLHQSPLIARESHLTRMIRSQRAEAAAIDTESRIERFYSSYGRFTSAWIDRRDGTRTKRLKLERREKALVLLEMPSRRELANHPLDRAALVDDTSVFLHLVEQAQHDPSALPLQHRYRAMDWREATMEERSITIEAELNNPRSYRVRLRYPAIELRGLVDQHFHPIQLDGYGADGRELGYLIQRTDESAQDFAPPAIAAGISVDQSIAAWQRLSKLELLLTAAEGHALPKLPSNSYQKVHGEREGGLHVTLLAWQPQEDASLSKDERAQALASTMSCQADHPDIQLAAAAFDKDEGGALRSDRGVVEPVARWIGESISTTAQSSANGSALDALQSRQGDCTEQALLAVALLRARGIPARSVRGASYIVLADGTPAFGFHAWAEAWVLGVGWMRLDPAAPKAAARAHLLSFGDDEAVLTLIDMLGTSVEIVSWAEE